MDFIKGKKINNNTYLLLSFELLDNFGKQRVKRMYVYTIECVLSRFTSRGFIYLYIDMCNEFF
jgi:hypothetical protein